MEREKIGSIRFPKKGITLRYYLLFSRKDGYGLEVEQEENGVRTSEVCSPIAAEREIVLNLGREICRGVVFPGYLAEIVEDQL